MNISRILIVGLGSIGKRHLRIARELFPEATIGVWRHKKSNDKPAEADQIFYAVDEAICFRADIAIIANPAPYHLSAARPLAEAGVHLLIEKPLAEISDGVSELIALCEHSGVTLGVGYNLRYLPSLRKFKSLLDEGIVGEIWSVKSEIGQYLPSWRPGADYRNCVSAQKRLGGGVLLELSHELDYMQWIFGDPQWVLASLSKQSNLEIDVEDNAHLVMGLKGGLSKQPIVASVSMDFFRHDTTRVCTAIGEHGTLRWDAISGIVDLFSADQQKWERVFEHQPARDESYIEEWKDFISVVSSEEKPTVSIEDGLKVLRLVDAARESAHSGLRVKVC